MGKFLLKCMWLSVSNNSIVPSIVEKGWMMP